MCSDKGHNRICFLQTRLGVLYEKSRFHYFIAGMVAATVCFTIMTTALAVSGNIFFNGINVSMNGVPVFQKEDFLELRSGQRVPASILYVDENGGGTTYLPVRWLSENLGVSITWNKETDTIEIEKGYTVVAPDDFLQELAKEWLVNGDYPKNAKGETYGPESLESIVGYPPDLIAAAATNGQEGYLRRSELAEYLSSDSPQDNSLPVYDLDGNVIGEFIFGNG